MNAYDEYETREELMRALESQIAQTSLEDGRIVYRLRNNELDALRAKYDAATRSVDSESKRRREIETRLNALTRERDETLAELERAKADAANPNELRDALRRSVEQANASKARVAALEAELKPLREENDAYKKRETRAKIETQLVDAARKMNCCETALRDVKRLAPLFRLNDADVAVTDDDKLVVEILQEELALSPHWLARSQGSEASSGKLEAPFNAREKFLDAMKNNDFAAVLRNAPRAKR